MSEIKLLPSDISNKIAAGEVVERPFNVVKELIENSIDAGADNVLVEIVDGGKALIKVTDNGKGILPGDLNNTVKRFATSKISDIDDVYSIKTFGFRGEALAAISSVSDFSIKSVRDGFEAKELIVKFGAEPEIKPCGLPFGTVVTVKNIFENVPARYKFLKSSSTEYKEILKFIKQFAVINDNISISLLSDGKNVFEVFKNENMKEKFSKVLKETDLVYFENKYEDMKINCCAGLPNVQRYRKDQIIIGVNGRLIKDNPLTFTIIQAYHRLMPDGKFPAVALNLSLNPKKLDVNIHPSKTNIKFFNSREVSSFVLDGLRDAIGENRLNKKQDNFDLQYPMQKKSFQQKSNLTFDITENLSSSSAFEPVSDYKLYDETKDSPGNFKIIGQLFDTVIVCEVEDEVLFIDQHIAHERILFEKYKKHGLTDIATIVLVEPILIDLSDEDVIILNENIETVKKFGFDYEMFGKNTIKITSVPTSLINKDIKDEFQKIAGEFYDLKSKKNMDYAIVTMACKTAIKAGEQLTHFEMNKLVKDLFETENPYTCPHGRPIVYKMKKEELFGKFFR